MNTGLPEKTHVLFISMEPRESIVEDTVTQDYYHIVFVRRSPTDFRIRGMKFAFIRPRDVFKSRLKYVKEGKEKTGVSKKRKEVGNESPLVSMFVVQNQQIVNLPFDKCSSYVDGTDNNDIFALVDGNLIFDLET